MTGTSRNPDPERDQRLTQPRSEPAYGLFTRGNLPGGVRFSFTGQEVKHLDGKQLQRVGIRPHIAIRQTLAGLRAGKDELLDRVLTFVATGK